MALVRPASHAPSRLHGLEKTVTGVNVRYLLSDDCVERHGLQNRLLLAGVGPMSPGFRHDYRRSHKPLETKLVRRGARMDV